jgi:hypothetical protein
VYEWDENRLVYDDIVYTVDGDTLLNNLQYTKVYTLNDHPTIFDTIRTLHCFMRQDNVAKKIWFIRHYLGETTEKLGYDLSVAIGDTVCLPAFDYTIAGDSLFKLNIFYPNVTVLANGSYRNYYGFTSILGSGKYIQYVEGISDYRSTFPNRKFIYDAFHQSYTMCMHLNNTYTWPAGTTPLDTTHCGFNLVSLQDGEYNLYKIYPNPANNYVDVDIPASFKIVSCELYGLVGNLIKKTNFQSGSNQIHFELSTYSSGIYIIVIKTLTNTYYNKLIINQKSYEDKI